MYRFLTFSLLVLCLCGSGCGTNQTLKDSWKFTTKQYRNYLNTPATLDMEATGNCENYELALGDAVLDLDSQLQKLIRAMENSDRRPDQEWVMELMRKFPWLSGVALADNSGNLMVRYPEYFMKEFDVSPLVDPDPKQHMASLRAYVQKTPLGPEIYLANPVFSGDAMKGLVVAYFDPRALVSLGADPGSFMLASSAGVLWAGRFAPESTPIGKENWEELLKQKSCGLIGESGKEFFWTTRYLGNLPLVYSIPTDVKNVRESSAQLDQLKRVDVSDAPPLKLTDPTLGAGEVGNLGAPNVRPAQVPGQQENEAGVKQPLKE